VRFVALAALAATFWLLVATARLVLDPPTPQVEPVAVAPVGVPTGTCKRADESLDWNDDVVVPAEPPVSPMSKTALVRGFNELRPRVSRCYQKYGVPGTAMVNVTIAKSGIVSSAAVTGRFAGTPTGACVEAAVKSATFPPSDGLTTPYPLQLK
jgi:hypothetical protein